MSILHSSKPSLACALWPQAATVSEVIELHRRIKEPHTRIHCGWRFTVLPDVFSPFLAPSGNIGLSFAGLPIFEGKRVLDIGCGSGVVTCIIALSGATEVVGVDINAAAIRNCRLNAEAICPRANVKFCHASLFDPISSEHVFDIIYADLPFSLGTPRDPLEAAFFDQELRSFTDLIRQLPGRLDDGSRAYLTVSDLDNSYALRILERQNRLVLHYVMAIDLVWMTLYLVELRRA